MKNLKIALLFTLLINAAGATAQPNSLPDQPGFYHMQVGTAQIFSILDGTAPLNVKEHLHGFPSSQIANMMHSDYLDTVVELTFSAFLVRMQDQLILIDAGSGAFMGPSLGKLIQHLQAIGVQPQDITAVLITHGHADHLGGLVKGNERVFPNATVYISKAESDYWLTEANKQKAGQLNAPFFDIVHAALAPYLQAGKVKTFAPGAQLFPGISSIDQHGHTPGHSGYLLESQGQHMLFVGDLVHIASVQFPNPAVTIDYDIDQHMAAAAREQEFKALSKNGYWIAAPHMSFPGIGHLKAVGKGYQWVPVNFSTAASHN